MNQLSSSDVQVRRRHIERFLLLGKSNPEIASLMGISLSTVKQYLNRMYQEHAIKNVKHKRIALVTALGRNAKAK